VRTGLAALIILSATTFGQSPPPCPANRPVDDIIAEVHKEQSKRRHRNSDPSPTIHCSWGWCTDVSQTPPTFPESTPRAKSTANQNSDSSTTSSDTASVETCGTAMRMALVAAHNVEVGDQYFEQKNYSGALMRYKDAREEKPEDVAIHVRLGRVYEKLSQLTNAVETYDTAQRLPPTEKWTDEAKSALRRLRYISGP